MAKGLDPGDRFRCSGASDPFLPVQEQPETVFPADVLKHDICAALFPAERALRLRKPVLQHSKELCLFTAHEKVGAMEGLAFSAGACKRGGNRADVGKCVEHPAFFGYGRNDGRRLEGKRQAHPSCESVCLLSCVAHLRHLFPLDPRSALRDL